MTPGTTVRIRHPNGATEVFQIRAVADDHALVRWRMVDGTWRYGVWSLKMLRALKKAGLVTVSRD